MPVLPLSSRTAWHRQVASSKASQCFAEGNADGFPRTQLAQLTESYIAKKKLEPQSPECDCHLDGLVLEHAEREGGFREIAILACLRSFSKFAAVDTLSSLRGDALEQPSFSKYLRCLIFAHHVAPAYVSETELKIAEALVKIRSGRGDPLASFCQAVVHHGTIANSVLLPSPYVNKLLDFCRFRQAYEAHLNLMRSQRRLMSLHNTVSWMRTISNLPFSETATEILRAQVPLWSLWQTWRPNYLRLMQWEGGRFTRRQKQRLAYVFDLEGPDTTGSGHATFKDAVPACFGSIRLSAPDASLIKRVLDTLDHAQRVGESAVDLFIHLCVDNAAGEESLSLAMEFLGSDDDSCCKAAQGLFAGLVPGADFSDRLVALTNGLPFLGSNTSARARLAATIVEDVTNTMCAAQEAYCTMLKDGIGESLATTICVFGAVILEAAWLLESLPAPFLEMVRTFPSRELLRGMLDHLQRTSRAAQPMKNYLAASLGGKGGDTASMLAVIQIEQQFWGKTTNVTRSKVIHAIRALPYMEDIEFAKLVRDQALVEDELLLQDALPILSRDTNVSCVEFARILGRRKERQCAVHDVWVSLFSLMMEQRMDSMLVWSCESLSIDEWFRWLSDLNIIFPTEDPRFPLSRIGFTGERLQWWSELSGKYYDAIHYVETMQRGRGDLKWLYLKEVANIEALLDSIQEPQKLETAYLSVLSYFDPTPTATAKVCNCLAALKGVSSHGRLCFSTVLARHILPVDEWPNGATQALLLGWFRSNNFSDADRTAVKRLAVLMDIRLSVQPAGFQSAKAALLADYGELIAQARRLEATRVALRVHDEKRTESILARLKMDNSRGLVDPAIPDALVDEVECIGEQEYEICLPLTGIRDHDRRIRGIQENARFLVVRVSYKSQPGFCLHLSSDYIADARHDYCCYSPGQDVAPFPSCLARLNPFTYLLTQSLRRLFTCGSTTLTSIHEHASAVVRSPAAQCLVCVSSFGGQIWRPTVCSSDACRQELSRAPLEVRLHNLLDDPPVLDFLLCCLHAAAQDTTLDLLPDCPIEKTLLTEVINSFPRLSSDTSHVSMRHILGTDHMTHHRTALLTWMSETLRGCMLSAPQGNRVPLMPGVVQFLMFNSAPEREQAFAARMGPQSSGVAFHGSPAPRLWRIITEGLKNMTDTPFMNHGAANGPGIYLADEPSLSLRYSVSFGKSWTNTAFSHKMVLFGCELQGHTPSTTHAVVDEARVLVRYVFLCPAHYFTPPEARLVENAMQMTYTMLRSGPAG